MRKPSANARRSVAAGRSPVAEAREHDAARSRRKPPRQADGAARTGEQRRAAGAAGDGSADARSRARPSAARRR